MTAFLGNPLVLGVLGASACLLVYFLIWVRFARQALREWLAAGEGVTVVAFPGGNGTANMVKQSRGRVSRLIEVPGDSE